LARRSSRQRQAETRGFVRESWWPRPESNRSPLTGLRELNDKLSRYIRRIEAGERIAITADGRVVAELVPPGAKTTGTPSRFHELVASGVIRPPLEAGDPTEDWPDIALPPGTAAELIDADRGEA
jgi:antitoxin (DNA-binding transcriptional repressor) of toxin-antitoxin stability system